MAADVAGNNPNPNGSGSNSLASRVINSYTTFSGIDITAIFDNMVLATLSGIATSLTREKVPVFTVGSANARSISRGKRACAGSIQFTLFDRDAFYEMFLDESHYYYAHADEINWLTNPVNVSEYTGLFFAGNESGNFVGGATTGLSGGGLNKDSQSSTILLEGGNTANGPVIGKNSSNSAFPDGGTATAGNNPNLAGAMSIRRAAQHADQVYPFDITLVAQNEYGRASTAAIIGVEIINEGGGISVDDITNEQQMTYIAITKLPWTSMTDSPRETLLGRATSITPNSSTTTSNNVDLYKTGGTYAGAPGNTKTP